GRSGAEGQSGESGDCADAERASAAGWDLHSLRSECGRADQRNRRAGGHARIRSGGARTAREEVFEDCVAGAGSTVGLRCQVLGLRKSELARQARIEDSRWELQLLPNISAWISAGMTR